MGSSQTTAVPHEDALASVFIAPEDDPYDPRKPEYIIPASTKDVMTENSRLRLKQIRRLEFALSMRERTREAKARTCEGGVLRHYRHFLQELHPGERAKTGVLAARDVPMPAREGPVSASRSALAPPTSSAPAVAAPPDVAGLAAGHGAGPRAVAARASNGAGEGKRQCGAVCRADCLVACCGGEAAPVKRQGRFRALGISVGHG
eukprot:CAMPEP_0175718508 /NCGR_PEP_ID=MMETSP0097-20121207/44203_1 /TAXON_ID=311494 /ORGANISM="Alexandrium monilatum, Strain CCMP3105" /LENGTH=204 /DNA_ID=CAMNT_0017026099 /DNA_START=29 /DNA_END=639 /DNA_ORIENTATION=+